MTRSVLISFAGLTTGLAMSVAYAGGRIALLDLGLPTEATVFESELAADHEIVRVPGESLKTRLAAEKFDLLILPSGPLYPADAADAILTYLRSGGRLFTSGGYAFDTPAEKGMDGVWRRIPKPESGAPQLKIDRLDGVRPVVLPPFAGWSRNGFRDSITELAEVRLPDGSTGLEVSTPELLGFNLAQAAFPRPAGDWNVLVVSFRGRGSTQWCTFELTEADGTRWWYHPRLTADWKEHRLTARDFHYHQDNKTAGRGGQGDRIDFSKVRQLQFGVTVRDRPYAPHAAAFGGVKVAKADLTPEGAERPRPKLIGSRYGIAKMNFMIQPEQVGLFDASYPLEAVARTSLAAESEGLYPALTVDGPLSGWAANARLSEGGWGGREQQSAQRAILVCTAADGAPRGNAAAIVHHFAGEYKGGSWAFFGVEGDRFMETDARRLIRPVVATLFRGLFLAKSGSKWDCYRSGETAVLETWASNFSGKPQSGRVRFTLRDERGGELSVLERSVTLAAGATERVEATWPVGDDAPAFVRLTVEMDLGGRTVDREFNAFCVWREDTIASGPKVEIDGTAFRVDGEKRFWTGAQTFSCQNRYHGTPLQTDADFRAMRRCGMRWTRGFLGVRTEEQRRTSDMAVLLAQRHGLVMYHCPMAGNVIGNDAAALVAEAEYIRAVTRRYRDVPGFVLDIRNEARTQGTHASSHRDGAAWMRLWADACRAAAKAERPDLAVSTGWCHGWAGGRATQDPPFASVNLDFADSHCYRPAELVNEFVKPMDQRVFGKPFVIGEYGSKVHPTLVAANPWSDNDTEDGQCARFREVAARAFGNGVSLFEIWMWRDTGVLVWGINHEGADGPVARKSVAVMSDVARTFGSLPLAENPPDTVLVMDEPLRWNDATRERTTARQCRVARALQKWGANFSCVTSSMTNALPGSVKCMIDAARVESLPGQDAELAVRVGDMLKRTGAFFTRREVDPPALDTWRVPGVGSHAWVFWNGGEVRIEVERDGHKCAVSPKRVGYLQVADDGSLVRSVEL